MRPLQNISGGTAVLEVPKQMKTRIISAAILIPVLLAIILAAPKVVTAILFGVLMAIGAYELLYRTGLIRHPRMVLYSAAMALAIALWSYFGAVHEYLVLAVLIFFMALFAEMMADHIKVNVEMVGLCLLGGLVIPYLLSALVRILTMKVGRYFVLIPFVVACANDAGAYFVGLKFGKHKLAPVVSPNKTIEGLLGGLLSGTVAMLIYALILQLASGFQVNYGYAIIYGLLGSCAGVMGDLCFSIIKRQTGIKDYGQLIPGHGGVLDRFDSMITAAPLIEVLLVLIPVAVG